MNVIAEGILAGLVLTMLVGPVFFKLIQTSMDKGFSTALFMILGIQIADIGWIVLSISGLNSFVKSDNFHFYSGIIGGIILIIFGTSNLLSKETKIETVVIDKKLNRVKAFVNGVVLNGINPSVALFWIAMVSLAKTNYSTNISLICQFFTAMIITTASTDLLKAYFSHYLRKILNSKTIMILNKVVGLLMIISGIVLIGKTYFDL